MATWEGESLKVKKMVSILQHKFDGDNKQSNTPIMCIAKNNHGKFLATGDNSGTFQICDENFRNVFTKREAHNGALQALSFSPTDSKLATTGDDSSVSIWAVGNDTPDVVLQGHQSDVKCCEWHPYRSLIASGSRDSAVRLWDPKQGSCVKILTGLVLNCCQGQTHHRLLVLSLRRSCCIIARACLVIGRAL